MSYRRFSKTAASIAAMGGFNNIPLRASMYKGPKNKYNLTPEQIELMKEMNPKEKKAFLKGITSDRNTDSK